MEVNSDVTSDVGDPAVRGRGKVKLNWGSQGLVVVDVPHRRAAYKENAWASSFPGAKRSDMLGGGFDEASMIKREVLSKDLPQRDKGEQAHHVPDVIVDSPPGASSSDSKPRQGSILLDDLPRRRTCSIDLLKSEQMPRASGVATSISQGASGDNRATQDASWPSSNLLLRDDLPRRSTLDFEELKIEQGRHAQDVIGDNSHGASLFNRVMQSVSSPPDACNVPLLTDLPRRRTFDIESLKDEKGCSRVDDDIRQDQNSKIVTHQASETVSGRISKSGWNMGSITRRIAEDHPRRTNGYQQIREEPTQGTITIPSVTLGSRAEASNMQGHRRSEPFISDVSRRRQVAFTSVGGYATENTPNYNLTFSQATHEVSPKRPEETGKAEKSVLTWWAFNDAQPLPVDIPRRQADFRQLEGGSLIVNNDQPHDSEGIDQRRSGASAGSFQQGIRRKETPVISDIPRRRSIHSTEEYIMSCEFDHSPAPDIEGHTTRQAEQGEQSAEKKAHVQVAELDWRWRLNAGALFPMDLPRPNVAYGAFPVKTTRPSSSRGGAGGVTTYSQGSSDRSLGWARRKDEPLLDDLPRRRPFYITTPEHTNALPSTRVVGVDKDKLSEDQQNETIELQRLEHIWRSASGSQCSPERASDQGIDASVSEYLWRVKRQLRKVREGNPVPLDFLRRRRFYLQCVEDACEGSDSNTDTNLISSSGAPVNEEV